MSKPNRLLDDLAILRDHPGITTSDAQGLQRNSTDWRSRMSNLTLLYGVAIEGKAVTPGTQVKSWWLREPYEMAVEKVASGRNGGPGGGNRVDSKPQALVKGLQQEKSGVSGPNYDPRLTGRVGGIKSGEARRVKAKGVKIGGRMMSWTAYRKELEDKKQGVLPV